MTARKSRKPGHAPSEVWQHQMKREQDYPPYFTPILKARKDKRFQAFMTAHVHWLVPARYREAK